MLSRQSISVLTACALRVREMAYAPYSQFKVGAMAVSEDERVFYGCNVENASYGLSLCAERAAISSAVSCGAKQIAAIVIATDAHPFATPCGACRQWMSEFGSPNMEIVSVNLQGEYRRWSLAELLPNAFNIPSDRLNHEPMK